MSKRWKFQILNGGLWGLLTGTIMGVVDWYDSSFAEAFLNVSFLGKLGIFVVVGIFGFGYLLWRDLKRRAQRQAR